MGGGSVGLLQGQQAFALQTNNIYICVHPQKKKMTYTSEVTFHHFPLLFFFASRKGPTRSKVIGPTPLIKCYRNWRNVTPILEHIEFKLKHIKSDSIFQTDQKSPTATLLPHTLTSMHKMATPLSLCPFPIILCLFKT